MLKITSLQFGFDASDPLFTRVSLEFAAGEFALVCGPTGSGKSTLLRCINGLAPHFTGGNLVGRIEIGANDVTGWQPHELAHLVGFVNQQPEGAFVTDTVAEELVYGMEQLGVAENEMKSRLESIAATLGLNELLEKQLTELSGGQQQRVAIAAALSAGQRILVLDEPTSALDPKAAAEIIGVLRRLSRDGGITVLLAEHRLERALPSVDSMVIVHGDGSVTKQLPTDAIREFRLVPPVVELSSRLQISPPCLSPQDERLRQAPTPSFNPSQIEQPVEFAGAPALALESISVNYGEYVAVDAVSFSVERGQVVALMGENGSGKTSLLWAIQGSGVRTGGTLSTPWGDTASMTVEERLCVATLVPQKASDLLFLPTVSEELEDSDRFAKAPANTTANLFQRFAGRVDPSLHPRDLSAGQQLALVLAIQLAKGAGILLLDEPTRGLDYTAKRALAGIIAELRVQGKAVVVATHDIEFAALIATDVVVLESGRVAKSGRPAEVFGVGGILPSELSQALRVDGLFAMEQIS
jgi:energy-coupling factor transport system ATP-binding protein